MYFSLAYLKNTYKPTQPFSWQAGRSKMGYSEHLKELKKQKFPDPVSPNGEPFSANSSSPLIDLPFSGPGRWFSGGEGLFEEFNGISRPQKTKKNSKSKDMKILYIDWFKILSWSVSTSPTSSISPIFYLFEGPLTRNSEWSKPWREKLKGPPNHPVLPKNHI